ncbi:MAG: amidohydrolase [Oscillospiraceae bacterium]|nr:amidohydrolase [Oscillospiraceae bacterium]
MNKKELYAYIDENKGIFEELADSIWECAEISLKEHKSAEIYKNLLENLGFKVETGLAGVETAFSGTFGSGKPIIGILGEFDALSGLSQKEGMTEHDELVCGGNGHGCGHNLLGAGSLSAAYAVKKYLEEKGEGSGTVIFYGCPGEEGGAGKAFMAQKGIFYGLDAALTWHPDDSNQVTSGSYLSSIQVEYKFEGVAAHAAGCPHLGRSALDAVELMNIGVQFLREHIPSSDRIHYSITDAGGISPNVVQPTAQVLYMMRSDTVTKAKALVERVEDIAKGAALMTGTTLKRRFIDGTADVVPNEVLEKAMYKNFEEIELPEYSEEELAFAEELKKTYITDGLPGFASNFSPEIAKFVDEKTNGGKKAQNDFLMPLYHSEVTLPGSTDVGDVSWQTPTVQINTATWSSGIPGHSWQVVSMGKSTIAKKGMNLAAKVIAATALDLFEDEELLSAAKAEFSEKAKSGYVCPIEEGAVPAIAGEKIL